MAESAEEIAQHEKELDQFKMNWFKLDGKVAIAQNSPDPYTAGAGWQEIPAWARGIRWLWPKPALMFWWLAMARSNGLRPGPWWRNAAAGLNSCKLI